MKCVCGYQKGHEWVDGVYQEVNPEGERFVLLSPDILTIEKEGNWSPRTERVTVYACPKCGTLKIEV